MRLKRREHEPEWIEGCGRTQSYGDVSLDRQLEA